MSKRVLVGMVWAAVGATVLPVHGEIIDVPSDFPTIRSAVVAAVDGDKIIVADGVYVGPGNKDIDFLGKAITIRSANGPATCTINCGGDGRAFIFRNGEGYAARVDGFTIVNGNVTGEPLDPPEEDSGGAILCMNGSNPTIVRCTFTNNFASAAGGGVMASASDPIIINCRFDGNVGGTSGGGGLYCHSESQPVVIGCLFANNESLDGSGGGGAIRCEGASPTLINCTVVNNTATIGGGMRTNGGAGGHPASLPLVFNSIFWGNVSTDFDNPGENQIYDGAQDNDNSKSTLDYCLVEDGWSGAGVPPVNCPDFNCDPLFVNPATDFRLRAGSPAIDSADNTAVPELLVVDLDGNPRFVDDPDTADTGVGTPPIVDMGSYEFQGGDLTGGDLNFDGVIDSEDLLILLSLWGECALCDKCLADLNSDCMVNAIDLIILLGNWG